MTQNITVHYEDVNLLTRTMAFLAENAPTLFPETPDIGKPIGIRLVGVVGKALPMVAVEYEMPKEVKS